MMKKLVVFLLISCMAVAFSACGLRGPEEGEPIDPGKTQLNVGNFYGDYGVAWLRAHADRFEEYYADYEFEPGKKGVQVHINNGGYVYDTFATTISNASDDVIFGEQCNTYNFYTRGSALDITDVVTTPLTEYGETQSIYDKMGQDDRDYLGINDNGNTKYFALPWYQGTFGFMYDIDLFERENLYFAAEGEGRNGFVINLRTPRSAGPDGKMCETCAANGYDYSEHIGCDDGLSATYDEFFELLDQMVTLNITPVVWAGNAQVYINNLLNALAADYEGYDQMRLIYTLDGITQAEHLVSSMNDNGTPEFADDVVEFEDPVSIGSSNGYLMRKTAGYYYGLKFIERLLTTPNADGTGMKYYDERMSTSSTYSHTAVQSRFLRGEFTEADGDTIGILIDGTFWHSGASATFEAMANTPGGSALERRLGIMPMPKVNETYAGEQTLMNNWMSCVVIRGTIDESLIPVAKQFLRFIHTNYSLSEFTQITGSVRPFTYTLEEDHEDTTTYYGKLQLNLFNNVKVVNPWSTNRLIMNNLSSFMRNDQMFNSNPPSGGSYNLVSNAIRGGVTAENYFLGLANYWSESQWVANFSEYF